MLIRYRERDVQKREALAGAEITPIQKDVWLVRSTTIHAFDVCHGSVSSRRAAESWPWTCNSHVARLI
jgi:hypothetical protein